MRSMGVRCSEAVWSSLLIAAAMFVSGCGGGLFGPAYEYEEDLVLSLDGSATVNVAASVAALVVLRGASLDVDPGAQLDVESIQRFFGSDGISARVRLSKRDDRPFVRVRVEIDDVTRLTSLRPFSWSSYRFERSGDIFEYRQVVGVAAEVSVPDVGWTGEEMVRFRVRVPSAIPFHNSPNPIARGNILQWEQPLVKRLEGEELELQINMQAESILRTTLLLFGSTILSVAIGFAVVVWWLLRRGRRARSVG